MPKSDAERRKKSNDKKRERGLIPKHIWVYPQSWPHIKKYIDKKNKEAEDDKS